MFLFQYSHVAKTKVYLTVPLSNLRPEDGKLHLFSFLICDRAAADKQEEKTDKNPTLCS